MEPTRIGSRTLLRSSRRAEVRHAHAARAEARRTARARRADLRRTPRPDEGFAMSSPLALMASAAIVLAGAAFVATDADEARTPEEAALVVAPRRVEPPATIKAKKVKKATVVQRTEVYVEVYNNSNITGLAGSTGARISAAGWQLVTTDNWYGTIPASTIYFPARLKAAAQLLGKDLGIERTVPAEAPMSMDRLTVVLTADFG